MSNETDLSLSLEVDEHQHVMTGQLVQAGTTEIYKEKTSGRDT